MATAREKNLLGEFMDFNSLLAAGARVRPGAPRCHRLDDSGPRVIVWGVLSRRSGALCYTIVDDVTLDREARAWSLRCQTQSSRIGLRVCSAHIPRSGTAAIRIPSDIAMYGPY
jgi:hypothetical protein